MRYEGMVYRPPSEARSLILQLTIGCARNECTFCSMYKDKKFRIRNLEEVVEDIKMAKNHYMPGIERVFLADGDALIVKTKDLIYIIDKIHEILPTVNRITVYGAPKDILVKKPEELELLREAGLNMVYMGAESGKVISAIKPEYASLLTLLIEPGTQLYNQWKTGENPKPPVPPGCLPPAIAGPMHWPIRMTKKPYGDFIKHHRKTVIAKYKTFIYNE